MTAPTPTEGIEPTIERIAERVCREYLGRILARAVGAPNPPATPTDGAAGALTGYQLRCVYWEPDMPDDAEAKYEDWDRVAAFVSEAVRKAREEERAASQKRHDDFVTFALKDKDAAVHQARVDALREAGLDYDFRFHAPGQTDTFGQWLVERADRLEREQAQTAGATEATIAGVRIVADQSMPKDEVRLVSGDQVTTVKLEPPEAKRAPEHAVFVETTPGDPFSLRYIGPENALRGTGYTRDDVVERRVAEAFLDSEACRVLDAKSDETALQAARRVVAELAELGRVAKVDAERAEAAEARVRELENRRDDDKLTIESQARKIGAFEDELLRVRAELAEANKKAEKLRMRINVIHNATKESP